MPQIIVSLSGEGRGHATRVRTLVEQRINAHFLGQTGAGRWAELDRVDPTALQEFERHLDQVAARIDRRRLDGLPAVLRVVEEFLPSTRAAVGFGRARFRPNRRVLGPVPAQPEPRPTGVVGAAGHDHRAPGSPLRDAGHLVPDLTT